MFPGDVSLKLKSLPTFVSEEEIMNKNITIPLIVNYGQDLKKKKRVGHN